MKTQQKNFIDDIQPTGLVVLIALAVGLLFVAVQQAPQPDAIQQGLRSLFAAVLWALACLIAGGFVGFLFGIPRILQSETPPAPTPAPTVPPTASRPVDAAAQNRSNYRPNTNLDQISDWLTKIIVGIGLINLQKVPERLSQASEFIGWSLGGREHKFFAGAIIIYFTLLGLLGTYLITRIYLSKIFEITDVGALGIRDGETMKLYDSDLSNPQRPTLQGAADAIAKKIIDVPLNQLSSLTEIIAWAKAQFSEGNYEQAVSAYQKAVAMAPDDVQLRLEYHNALFHLGREVSDEGRRQQLRSGSQEQLLKALELVNTSQDPVLKMKVHRALTFHFLYDPPPDGFRKVIQYATEYEQSPDPRKIRSGGLLVNLASAYGQKWKWLKQTSSDERILCEVRDEAYTTASEALRIDNNQIWLNRLRQLLQKGAAKDPADDDLEVFENDNKFRRLLGLSEIAADQDTGRVCDELN